MKIKVIVPFTKKQREKSYNETTVVLMNLERLLLDVKNECYTAMMYNNFTETCRPRELFTHQMMLCVETSVKMLEEYRLKERADIDLLK